MKQPENIPIEAGWQLDGGVLETMDLGQCELTAGADTGHHPTTVRAEINGDTDFYLAFLIGHAAVLPST